MEQLLNLLIGALPLIVPPVVALVREHVTRIVPDRWVPVLLATAGGGVGATASLAGVDAPADLAAAGEAAWVGVVIGLASVGVHQVWRQLGKEG